MSNLRNLNQAQSFWDWANSFDNTNSGPSNPAPWGYAPHAPTPQEYPGSPPPPPAEGEHHMPAPPPPGPHSPDVPGLHKHGHHGRHGHHGGPRGRGGPGWRGRYSGPFERGFPGGPWGGFGGPGAGLDIAGLRSWFGDMMRETQGGMRGDTNDSSTGSQDFTPAIDIFSTPEAYVIHASLPGAAKEDIAVSWDAGTSTLMLTGVVHRPGDEELLKALEVSERRVGAFERKIVLGTKEDPAKVDEDAISAKLENGILRIEVMKLGQEEAFVEVKKVDVE